MSAKRPLDPLQFSRRIAVETPEHVVLEFELAGVGSRAAAAVYDALILGGLFGLLLVGGQLTGGFGDALRGWAIAAWIGTAFALIWGYFVLFEALAGGCTPGKRRLGIRVVMDTGHPITFPAAAVRNLLRLADIQPLGSYFLAIIFVFFHSHNKRLGDMVAGTIVVRDEPETVLLGEAFPADESTIEIGEPVLPDDEFQLLERFLHRMESLGDEARAGFTARLVGRFRDRFPERDPHPEVFLVKLYASELAKRRSRAAARKKGGVTKASGTAHRFVALRQRTWETFRSRAAALQRQRLTNRSGAEVLQFAAEYREVAADLARARTYGVDPRVVAYLGKIVSAGHNVLYGLQGVRRYSVRRLLLGELPAAVIQARLYILAAFLMFLIPGIVGYLLIRERPAVANEVIDDTMIARAEAGQRRQAEGIGYAEAPSPYLPVVATSIVANNVQVAFGAFAFGITAGVGTVLVLGFNGLFFGAVLGLFANYGLTAWILTFVAGHGVLELTAIFIAGGAGLLLARAIVAPGDLTRRDALVVHGRLAVRLVGAATCLLILAGVIEGFLSASDAPAAFKVGVSAASAVLLALYLLAGRQAAGQDTAEAPVP